VTVPRIFVAQVPDQWRVSSCRQVRPGLSSGSGSGCLSGVLKAVSPVTTHGTNIRIAYSLGCTRHQIWWSQPPKPHLVQHNIWWGRST
jgi:hypothetical protein